jgi:hypothetical protein
MSNRRPPLPPAEKPKARWMPKSGGLQVEVDGYSIMIYPGLRESADGRDMTLIEITSRDGKPPLIEAQSIAENYAAIGVIKRDEVKS